ncbi:hypothetical protein Metal_0891 [Methylomicrobium album BG8]|uniref:Uncharacterized protein n=1 Tax=Methylomicrobium album BG8 TaxID=686340 RepID=H8GFW4_METAL|nr:hypothetical protein Metal_0891 [Methylomicrobium album BG8]
MPTGNPPPCRAIHSPSAEPGRAGSALRVRITRFGRRFDGGFPLPLGWVGRFCDSKTPIAFKAWRIAWRRIHPTRCLFSSRSITHVGYAVRTIDVERYAQRTLHKKASLGFPGEAFGRPSLTLRFSWLFCSRLITPVGRMPTGDPPPCRAIHSPSAEPGRAGSALRLHHRGEV